ncbi:MAG: hypothetical protein FWG88_02675 [Oscillospiraceae bacterium]|nr:hypothetical protein [Oscillospiraceae bacterium]
MFKQSEYCHVCFSEMKLKKNESLPDRCPVCKTDLSNPETETIRAIVECKYRKGALSLDEGELTVTNLRVFFIKGAVTAKSLGGGIMKETVEKQGIFRRNVVTETLNPLSTIAVTGIAAKVKSKGAGQISIEIPHGEITTLDDFSKGTNKGVIVRTKSGEEYNLYYPDPSELKELLNPYVS